MLELSLLNAGQKPALNHPSHDLPVDFSGAIHITRNLYKIYEFYGGMASNPYQISCSSKTQFLMAEASQSITAVVIMDLIHHEKLDLHTPIGDYLPTLRQGWIRQLTIHQLLCHHHSLPPLETIENFYTIRFKRHQKHHVIELLNSIDWPTSSISHHASSSLGYVILSHIVQTVTSEEFGAYLRATFFEPLGMKNTYVLTRGTLDGARRDSVHALAFPLMPPLFPYGYDFSLTMGYGGIVSTLDDIMIWIQNLWNQKIIPYHRLRHMLQPYNANWGYGVRCDFTSLPGWKVYGSLGKRYGFHNLVMHLDPPQGDPYDLVVLSNRDDSDLWSMALRMVKNLTSPPKN